MYFQLSTLAVSKPFESLSRCEREGTALCIGFTLRTDKGPEMPGSIAGIAHFLIEFV